MCRGALTATLASIGALLLTANAGAATPQQIYRDLADNGRLDRAYSRADLDRALNNPTLPAYARPEHKARTPQARPAPAAVVPTDSVDDSRTLPFTGLDAALFGAVGGPLLLLVAGMRRFVRGAAKTG